MAKSIARRQHDERAARLLRERARSESELSKRLLAKGDKELAAVVLDSAERKLVRSMLLEGRQVPESMMKRAGRPYPYFNSEGDLVRPLGRLR